MNSTEREYAQMLDVRIAAKEIVTWRFESVKFRLADNTMYTPDFLVITPESIELHEVKGGFFRDDARVKFKVAGEAYPWFKWVWAQKKKGAWKKEVYGE